MTDPIRPMLIGRDNAHLVIGRSWRWVQDTAVALGVRPIRIGRVSLYDAGHLIDAIRSAGASDDDAATGDTELERLRARLGKRRRVARHQITDAPGGNQRRQTETGTAWET